jgi:hypothetical protein
MKAQLTKVGMIEIHGPFSMAIGAHFEPVAKPSSC